jgi:hypothetical protein
VAAFEDDLDPMPSHPFSKTPRRDGMALGFGLAFLVFGVLGLLRAAGLHVDLAWLYPIIFFGLGAAGLVSALLRERR